MEYEVKEKVVGYLRNTSFLEDGKEHKFVRRFRVFDLSSFP